MLDDWDWLAFAQHLGVPTRLLDWSTSPLCAAFFALEEDKKENEIKKPTGRLIYCLKYSHYIHNVGDASSSPFECRSVGRFSPRLLFDRIRFQRGVFTIHPIPTQIFYHPSMKIIYIPESLVLEFRKHLFKYGVDFWHIYPDAKGLGQQLQWQLKYKIGLGAMFKSEEEKSLTDGTLKVA